MLTPYDYFIFFDLCQKKQENHHKVLKAQTCNSFSRNLKKELMDSLIDMDTLLVFTKDNKEMAIKIVQAYVSAIPSYIQEAEDAVATKDPTIIRAMCHKLMGAAKSVKVLLVIESIEHLHNLQYNININCNTYWKVLWHLVRINDITNQYNSIPSLN